MPNFLEEEVYDEVQEERPQTEQESEDIARGQVLRQVAMNEEREMLRREAQRQADRNRNLSRPQLRGQWTTSTVPIGSGTILGNGNNFRVISSTEPETPDRQYYEIPDVNQIIGLYVDGSSKDQSLRQQKMDYINKTPIDDIEKECGWVKEPIRTDRIIRFSNQRRDNESAVYVTHTESGKDPFKDSVTFDEFKKSVFLGFLKIQKVTNLSINSDGHATSDINTGNPFSIHKCIATIVANVDGLELTPVTNGNVRAYIETPRQIKKYTVKLNTRYDGEIIRIEKTMDFPETTDIESYVISVSTIYSELSHQIEREFHDIQMLREVDMRRPNVKSKKFRYAKKGLYIKHSVPFSCEIECYGTNKKTTAEFSRSIPKEIGLSGDGSLQSPIGYPIELQTPVLSGKRGEILLAETCTKMVDMGFKIDKTCGLHIHLDGGCMNLNESREYNRPSGSSLSRPQSLINLYLFHRVFEDVIISFLPSTRRLNRYCASFKEPSEYHGEVITPVTTEEVFKIMKDIKTVEQFELYWYRASGDYSRVLRAKSARYTPSRYYGCNFHSLLKDNHFEVRYHSGTLNYEKIFYWINLHGSIMEKCSSGEINEKTLKSIFDAKHSVEELTKILYDTLQLDADTVEYLNGRQETFKDIKDSEEILIDKTKKLGVA